MNYTQVNSSLIEYNLIHLPQLVFEVTDACNLRCKYCGYSELYVGYDEREGLNFPFHKAKLIIDYLHSLWKTSYDSDVIRPMNIGFYSG